MRAPLLVLGLIPLACSRSPRAAPRASLVDHPAVRAPSSAGEATLPPPFHTPSARNPAEEVDRPAGTAPRVAGGLRVTRWAQGFQNARSMALAPDSSVFVSEAGAGRVTVLRDDDHDGVADGRREVFARDLELPFGLAFHPDGWLYVGCTNRLVRFRVAAGQHLPTGGPVELIALPGRGYRQHWTRSVALSADGTSTSSTWRG